MADFTALKQEIASVIKSNNKQGITGETLQGQLVNMVNRLDEGFTEDLEKTDEKVAQLSQEWQEIKDANFVVNIEVLPHIAVEQVTGGAAILQPDKLYDFGEVANLAIGFEAPAEGNAANYAFQFKSPADAPTTITMPDSVVFPVESDSMFNVKAGRTYQVTILNNLASATSWEV